MMCGFVVSIKTTEGLDVVDIKRPPLIFRSFTASLTSETVSLAGRAPRLAPSWPAPVLMTSKPCRAVFPVHIPGFSLPIKTAVGITKYMFPNPARESHNRASTIATYVFGTFHILWVIRPAWSMFTPIFFDTGDRTKVGLKPLDAVYLSYHRLPAVATWNFYAGSTGFIPTGKATILLARVITRWQKRLTTLRARLLLALDARLIGASNRAKSNFSISPFRDWFAASFTLFHTLNYSID